ncbi:MAG: hypothetical protein HEP80_19415 [Dolichospermum sp. UKL201]|jgi:hypothetical protein|nr:MAG: hypothetical protein HEP80_19415 [Dolichospermum sp. UKL201]
MKIGICKLCGTEQELINKSHIIPRQFYRYSSEEVEKEIIDKTSNSTYLYSKEGKLKQIQCGLFVGDILCKSCENLIGKWDKYGQKLLLRDIDTISQVEAQGTKMKIKFVENFNYNSLKLFFMSVLWRSHIARNHFFVEKKVRGFEIKKAQFFQQVNLGEKWENNLRTMLLLENPGTEDDFSVLLFKYTGKESYIHLPPIKGKDSYNEANLYRFMSAGYSWFIKVDKRPFHNRMRSLILKPDQPLYFVEQEYKKTSDFPNISEFVNSLPEDH